ncbi:MAG: ABC transporter permease [Chromatiales bacterium]|nr:ABC transporter permease [Chromatiales bacterium]
MTAAEQLVAFQTIVEREILRFARIWIQTVLPPMITTALYFIIFGQLIGSQIGDIDGFRYMDFLVPGVILMTVIQNSYANVVSSVYGARFQRHIEEMAIAPVPGYVILGGFVAGGLARGLTVGIAVLLVSLIFSPLGMAHPLVTIAIVVLTSVLFSLAGFINGMFARNFDDISIIPTFVLTPLTYLGGVFYSVSMLPPFWQDVSLANPILYMVNAFRFGLIGTSDIDLGHSFLITGLFVAALGAYSLHLLRTGRGIRS